MRTFTKGDRVTYADPGLDGGPYLLPGTIVADEVRWVLVALDCRPDHPEGLPYSRTSLQHLDGAR